MMQHTHRAGPAPDMTPTPAADLAAVRAARLVGLRRAWSQPDGTAQPDSAAGQDGGAVVAAAQRGAAGAWCLLPSPQTTEMLSRCGFDYLCVDTQHGLARGAALGEVMQVLRHSPTAVIVRVPALDDDAIGRALDLGADGVIVPMVRTAGDVATAVAAAKYPPAGHRSWGPTWGDIDGAVTMPPAANAATLVAVMIETSEALEDIDAIVACPGLDAVYVGPNDLSLALGLGALGPKWSAGLVKAIERIAAACRARAMPLGLHCTGPAQAQQWCGSGATWFTVATDTALLRGAALEAVSRYGTGGAA